MVLLRRAKLKAEKTTSLPLADRLALRMWWKKARDCLSANQEGAKVSTVWICRCPQGKIFTRLAHYQLGKLRLDCAARARYPALSVVVVMK